MTAKKFDIIVIGGGPGGYPAAIKAAQSGKSVALVEAKELGGTCLNRGCIPSKSLISDAETYHQAQKAESVGILQGKISFDFKRMASRKDDVVNNIRKSLEGLITANKITVFRGFGKFISSNQVKVIGKDNVLLEADKIIIATGSEPRNIQAFPFDYKQIHDSTSLLALEKLPKSIVIVGGGVIGCEFASLYNQLGVQVTILELLPRILPMEDAVVANALAQALQKRGIKIHAGVQVKAVEKSGHGVKAIFGENQHVDAEIALISVGRRLNTVDIGLEKIGIAVNQNGSIPVNEKMETVVPGIYAVGDIASRWALAHVASHQGIVAASNAVGELAHMDYSAVPSVTFTDPEVATVGLSLEEAQKQGYSATIGLFPFAALGKSQASLKTDGFAQIVIDKDTGQILGAQVIGFEASTLIAEMALAIRNELTIECIAETIHAHPTIAEAWLEAALVGMGSPIHWPPKKAKG